MIRPKRSPIRRSTKSNRSSPDSLTSTAYIIREAIAADLDGIWQIFHEVVAAGETYPYDPQTTRDEAIHAWCSLPRKTFVAVDDSGVLGTYYLKDNSSKLGAHVCNAGYMVASRARGRGLGKVLCQHSLEAAKALGYRAMQYNLVVATNTTAVKLWRSMGFQTVGTLPEAFNHKGLGLVDAYVMYRTL